MAQAFVRATFRAYRQYCDDRGIRQNSLNLIRFMVQYDLVRPDRVRQLGARLIFEERYNPLKDGKMQVIERLEVELDYSARSIQTAVNTTAALPRRDDIRLI